MSVPRERIRVLVSRGLRLGGHFVLYWMVANRRLSHNFALDHAVDLARRFERPLLIFEPLGLGYAHASHRFHAWILDGMAEHQRALAGTGVGYLPYVELVRGEGRQVLERLASDAVAIVTDDYPIGLPRGAAEGATRRLSVRLEAVDSNGLYPARETDRVFTTAASFRRHLQKRLVDHLAAFPFVAPRFDQLRPFTQLADALRRTLRDQPELGPDRRWLSRLPISQSLEPVGVGGTKAARERWADFLARVRGYDEPDHPDRAATSGLSPYLHFGHISSHELFSGLAEAQRWSPTHVLGAPATGRREGWWGMSPGAEAFLDQLVTWRELGFNRCVHDPHFADYESLPRWARETLETHAADPRPDCYSLERLESARTHDELWNAAQRQLVSEGVIHGYLRMLWGKKILEWSPTPRVALERTLELNDKYAIDGRDPNSYSGITWCLGRYDRAWGPERPIFGKVRYMSSESARRKLRLREYLRRHQA